MNSKIRGRIATSILIGGVLGIVAGIALALVVNHNREREIPTINGRSAVG